MNTQSIMNKTQSEHLINRYR